MNAEGKREVVGMNVGISEDGVFWLSFLRSLSARGLRGVEFSDLRCTRGSEGRDSDGVLRCSWRES